ncbi:DUF2514 family protein [Pseudomonas sp. ESBL1]|uniref:DUF2514 family protein n=1 Tax=Pseudomonas sp. ESBL1 TaxID=3077324 RepID=UPI002FC6B6ED
MRTSQRGLSLIKSFEGLRLQAYKDAVGVWTIGYGTTQGVNAGMKISKEQAERMQLNAGADAAGQRLQHDAANFAATVRCPGPDTAALARSQAATRAAMVLSDLLTRADARAGELAKAYDRARIAGQQCEAEYDALIRKPEQGGEKDHSRPG